MGVVRRTLSQFHGEKIHVLSFFHGVGIFLLTFLCSMALGVLFGLGCSLMLKHSELGEQRTRGLSLGFFLGH
jgi:sodium/hydrogen exchanger-like protein 6/7